MDNAGNAWLGRNKTLLVYDREGNLITEKSLPERLRAMTLDNTHQTVWIATTRQLLAYDANGVVLQSFPIGQIQDVAVDYANQVLWVVRANQIEQYSFAGAWLGFLVTTRPYGAVDSILPDQQGGLWIKAGIRLYRQDIAMGGVTVAWESYFDALTAGIWQDWVINPANGHIWPSANACKNWTVKAGCYMSAG